MGNDFGQRVKSGVSLVDWEDERIHLKCLCEVKSLNFAEGVCESVNVQNNDIDDNEIYSVKPGGKVILCGGSASPRLLMRTKELKNGQIDRLIFLVSSLYLAFLPFNGLKRLMGRFPILFTILSNTLRILLTIIVSILDVLNGLKDFLTFQGWGATQIKISTSLLKFNTFADGHYEEDGDKIILNFFKDERDFLVAEKAIKDNLDFLESLGSKPPLLLRGIFRLITKIPYEPHQVARYVEHFSKKTLLSEQHLAGGCLFGKVIDKGEKDPLDTGKVFDTTNLYVADLSCVPLPRVSTQMTAYLIGHYVGKQIFSPAAIVEEEATAAVENNAN